MSATWWEVRPTAAGTVGLFPCGQGFDDPRDQDKPMAQFDPVTAIQLAYKMIDVAAVLRPKDFSTER